MYWYRMWHHQDLPWLDQAAARAAWESLSDEERQGAAWATVAQSAIGQVQQAIGMPGWGLGIIAFQNNRPVGFVAGSLGPDTTTDEIHGHIVALWVEPEHRRRGLGRYLRSLAEEHFARTGVRKVKIWTGLHNQPFVALAKAGGYEPEGLIGMKDL
jgi:ribosomal protein S18 acetylase RimI-like enzyme